MDFSNDNMPWDLIIAALQQDLTEAESLEFSNWLSVNPEHRERFSQIQQLWTSELADYPVYKSIDEHNGWKKLQERLVRSDSSKVVQAEFSKGRVVNLKRWMSVAAIFVLVAGGLVWYSVFQQHADVYETALNEQKKVPLADGSSILLNEGTKISVPSGFNNGNRTIVLEKGNAFFDVVHNENLPFIVKMGDFSAKDIGTSFSILKTNDSLRLEVKSGRVAFIDNSSQQQHELSAGMTLSCLLNEKNPGRAIAIDSSAFIQSLQFNDTPLSDVVRQIELAYGRKIILEGVELTQMRFTAQLGRQTFDQSMEIIRRSLNLESTEKNGVYVLRLRNAH